MGWRCCLHEADAADAGWRVDASFVCSKIDDSLSVLQLETIDVRHLHVVTPADSERVVDECLPLLQRAQREGKIRHAGISELWNEDLSHSMLDRALDDDYFDVTMVGCNMLNSSTARSLPKAERRGVATLIMFAVRKVFADLELLGEICSRPVASG